METRSIVQMTTSSKGTSKRSNSSVDKGEGEDIGIENDDVGTRLLGDRDTTVVASLSSTEDSVAVPVASDFALSGCEVHGEFE